MRSSQSSQTLNGGFELLCKGHFPDELIVLFECGKPGEGFELLKSLFFMLIPIFVHLFLVVFFE